MNRIYAIAINTFREAVRDRVLFGILAFSAAMLLFTLALAQLSLNQEQRVVHDVGLASISLSSVLIAIVLGSSLLYKEIERKTLYVILPKPISRHEFLLGKYFGITLTALVFLSVMGAFQCWVSAIQMGRVHPLTLALPFGFGGILFLAVQRLGDASRILLPWSLLFFAASAASASHAGVDVAPVAAAVALFLGEVLIVAAVALLFSSFSTPFLTGVLTLGVWLVGRSADAMATAKSNVLGAELKALLHGLARVVPNLNLFVPGRHALEAKSANSILPVVYLADAFAYSLLYAGLLLLLAALIFRKRDFA